MGSVLSVSVVSCALVWSAFATHDGQVCDDAWMQVFLFLPGCDLNSVRQTSRLWRTLLHNALEGRHPQIGDTAVLCLDSAKIAHCAKWLRDENKDKGDQSAVLLTPMANVHFSFGEDDPVHPLGLHPCTVYSRAHPKGRHTMWQIPRQEWTQYPDLLEILLTESDTPDAPCQQCRLTENQDNTQLLSKITLKAQETPLAELMGYLRAKVQSNLGPNQMHAEPDLCGIAKRDPRFPHSESLYIEQSNHCWRSGETISQIFLLDLNLIYQAVFDVDCHSIRLCWRDGRDLMAIQPSLKDHCLLLQSDDECELEYCTLTGKMIRKAIRGSPCAKCQSRKTQPDLIPLGGLFGVGVQIMPSDDLASFCIGIHQKKR